MKKLVIADIAISAVLVFLALSIDGFGRFILPIIILVVIMESFIASRNQ